MLRTFSKEYPPSTVEGSKTATEATCIWLAGDSRYRNVASMPVSRCMDQVLRRSGYTRKAGA